MMAGTGQAWWPVPGRHGGRYRAQLIYNYMGSASTANGMYSGFFSLADLKIFLYPQVVLI